jgi:hypothetical protein
MEFLQEIKNGTTFVNIPGRNVNQYTDEIPAYSSLL